MDLYAYAAQCSTLEDELHNILSENEIILLRNSVSPGGWSGWLDWFDENFETISGFQQATPSVRRQRKSWNRPDMKGRLVLGAIHRIQFARNILAPLSSMPLDSGISYRNMIDQAADLYLVILSSSLERWPFDGDDPFETS